jgi:transcriptional regulator with XRE-family HTH domain
MLAEMAVRQRQVAQRLGQLREQHELTQEQAAQKVGITVRQWQRWEDGTSMPHARNLKNVADAFKIKVTDFFDEAEIEKLDRVLAILEGDEGLVDVMHAVEGVAAAIDTMPVEVAAKGA